MTSLAKQLERLAVPVVQPVGGVDTRRVSLLFNPTEAANLDREAVYCLGVSGVEVLERLDESFSQYKSSLFSTSSQTWERTVQNSEANRKLDELIHNFLIHASPYLLVKATHKALEWLIYRFHIHLFNVDDLILCALPYHDTKLFVRLLQLLKLENPTSQWHWLHNAAKSGTPLSLEILSNQCRTNPGFLSLLCDLVPKFIKVHGASSSHLGAVVAMATSCLLATVQNKDDITERIVSILVPHLVRGFKTKCRDFCAGCYMVFGLLCTQMTLKGSVVNMLVPILTKKIRPGLTEEALQCLCVVFQTQNLQELPKKSFKHLCKLPGLVHLLSKLSHQFVITAFLRAFLCRLIPLACEAVAMETFSNTEGSEDFGEGPPQYSNLLLSIIQDVELQRDLTQIVSRSLLESLLSQRQRICNDSSDIELWSDVTRKLLSALERKYTSEFDAAVETTFTELGTDNAVAISYLHQMTAFTTLPVKYNRVGDKCLNLSLGLNHAKKSMRVMATRELVNSLKEEETTDDSSSVEEMLLARLNDSEFDVVKEVLELKQHLTDYIGAEKLQTTLLAVIEKHYRSDQITDSLLCPITLLLDYLEKTPGNITLMLRMLTLVLITDTDKVVTIATVAEMLLQEVLKRNIPILQNPAKEWLKIQYRTTEPDPELLKALNSVLFRTLAESFVQAENTQEILEMIPSVCHLNQKSVCLYVGVLVEMLQAPNTNKDIKCQANRYLLEVVRSVTNSTKVKIKCELEELSSPFSHQAGLLVQMDGSQEMSPYFLSWAMAKVAGCLSKFPVKDTWPAFSDPCVKLQLELLDFFTLKYYQFNSHSSVWTKLLTQYIKDLGGDRFLSLCTCFWSDPSSVSPELYAGSFTVVAAILSKCRDTSNLLRRHKAVFPSLLTSLASDSATVRGAVLDCLKLIKEHGKQNTHSKLVKRLVKREDEIMADPLHLPQVMGKFYAVSDPDSHAERKASLVDLQMCVKTADTPLPVKERLLRVLSCVPCKVMMATLVEVGKHILENLHSEEDTGTRLQMLAHILTRFDEDSAEIHEIESPSLELFINCLGINDREHDGVTPATLAVKQLTKQFFHALPSLQVQQKLFSVVMDTILSPSGDAEFVTMATSKLRHLKPDACHVQRELNLDADDTELRTLKGHKRSRHSAVSKPLDFERVTLVLEVMQARKKVKDCDLLVTLMFKLLNRLLATAEEGIEYCKQLVLSILHTQCTKWTDQTKPKNQELVNAELLVQCLRSSHGNLHTQQQTLHLLSALAALYPEYILHNVMSVFTFLGSPESGLLQQEDSHTYQTITVTMETLIPALIKAHSGDSDRELLHQHIAQILQVFVDARYHIPKHRTLPLFSTLLREVGELDFLWVLLVLIVESSVRGKDVPAMEGAADIVDKDKSPLDKDVDFACSICDEIPASVQVITATKILVFLQKMTAMNQDGKGEASLPPRLRRKQENKRGFPLSVDTLSSQQLRLIQYTTTKMVVVMLSRDSFLAQMATELHSPQESFKDHFQMFVEAALSHMNRVSKAYGSHGNQPTFKFWKALFGKVSDIMDKVSYLLPSSVFIEMISKLLQHDQISMRKKAMDLLSNKLQHLDISAFQGEQLASLLHLVDMLLSVVQTQTSANESEADQAVMRQFALFNLKVLCKMIGQDNKEHFEKLFPAVVSLLSDPAIQAPVLGNCLLCLSELVTSLKVKAISQLHTFMPPLLRILGNCDLLQTNELFLVCTLTALQKILASLPYFLSPYLLEILVLVSHVSCFVSIDGDSSTKKSQPVIRLKAIRQHIAMDIPTRVLIPAVTDAYTKLLAENQLGIACILSVIQVHTGHITREDLSANQNTLLTFYCKALDFRNDSGEKIPYSSVQELESKAADALVTMVIRLTELAFRPMFYRLHEWACADDTQLHRNRKLTFFRLCDKMSEKLRSLFNIFVTHSLKVACHTLEVNNMGTNRDGVDFYEGADGQMLSVELVGYILSMLHKCLQCDTEGFVTKEIFNMLVQPLINQLENFQSLEDVYSDHVTRSVVPVIGQLAVAARDDTAWKSLNYAVCLKTKHSTPKVRFAALKALEEVAIKLGEEYMSLLPESIPFLAELMEDESEEVEQQCHHLVSKLEELLGESLQSYF